MFTVILYAFVALVTTCYLSDWLFSLGDVAGAPPRAKSQIPLIGHLLGLLKSGTLYYSKVSKQERSEVYTIGLFNFKIYVINSRRMIPLVQRLSKTLSFAPFAGTAAKLFINCSTFTVDLFGNADFLGELNKAERAALAPGPHLDYQNLRAINTLNDIVEEVLMESLVANPAKIRLYEWTRHLIALAGTNGVYGSSNPFKNKKIEEAFWAWNDGIPTLIAGLSLFAGRALKARQDLIYSFNQYLKGDCQDAAQVFKERTRVLTEHGVPADDIARQAVGFNVALLSNSAPTAFWTVFNIFSRPELLQELRTELEKVAVNKNAEDSWELDILALKTKCPRLLAALEETQRHLTVHANIRKVMEDTTLDTYHLQKGNYLQIPNAPIHHDVELWGPEAETFDPHRFVKNDGTAMSSSLPSYSYLAWGAAPHLCPARQFASTEILALAALLILRVDIVPLAGKWRTPEKRLGDLVTVLPPKTDCEVELRERDGWSGKWDIKIGESTSKVPLTSG